MFKNGLLTESPFAGAPQSKSEVIMPRVLLPKNTSFNTILLIKNQQ
ncbi:hypothetical protein yfred0001_34980 [Yersinia frederiksenii ATCC 33641]|nr:hypothetical protein yfred0001_34980 [Yersinia frederiksenii ATCC 33641]